MDLIVALGGDRWQHREAAGLLKKGMAGHIMLTGTDVGEESLMLGLVEREIEEMMQRKKVKGSGQKRILWTIG
jgi:hypothetical protein